MKDFATINSQLMEKGVVFDVVTFTDLVVSARDTDTSLANNYDPANAIKTLLISTKDGFKAVIMRGADRIDQPKLKAIVGKWRVLDSDTLQRELELSPGTVCPLVLDIPILIDESTLELKIWSMGAGANDKGINVESLEALKYLKDSKIVSIKL